MIPPGRYVEPLSTLAAMSHEVLVLGLLPERDYVFAATATSAASKDGLEAVSAAPVVFRTEPLPSSFPRIEFVPGGASLEASG